MRDLFIKFVGYIGHEDKEDYAILDQKGTIHEGEALPEPIDEITDKYYGITDYQADSIFTYRDSENLLNIWSRGFGKTWKTSWLIEFTMKYEADKFLYFSLTDVAYMVGDWVYLWADRNQAIVVSQTVKIHGRLSGRKATYQKFGLINGARFEIHGIRTTSTLGFHGWIIIFDDIIDIEHKRLTHLQKVLERKWNSQYSKIRRKKLVIDNTRKFAGDFFDFIISQFEKKGKRYSTREGKQLKKYLLTVDHKTPYRELYYKGDIPGYRVFTKRVEKKEIVFDPSKLLAPWYTEEDFEAMKLEDIESFYAEIIGIPMEIEGGMINPGDILYAKRPHFSEGVQMGGTGVDSASTESETNDYCAIVSCVSHGEDNKETKELDKRFTVYKSDVERILARNFTPLSKNSPYDWISEERKRIKRGLIEMVQVHCEYFKLQYPGKQYIVAMERNNAGIAFMEQALRMYRNKEKVEIQKNIWVVLDWPKFLCPDPHQAVRNKRFGKQNIRLGITHIQEKVTRIYAGLKYSIERHETRFTFNLEDTLLMSQLKSYPGGKFDDGPDATEMIKDELNKRWHRRLPSKKPREVLIEERKGLKAVEAHRLAGMPWLKGKQGGRSRKRGARIR